MLFAQAAPGPGGVPPNMWALIAGMCSCYLLIIVGYHLVIFFCCRTLARALHQCHPDSRRMQPGLTYLNLIPCFNHVWCFVTVIQVASSLQSEFEDRRLDEGDTDYGRTIGLSFAVIWLLSNFVQIIPGALGPQFQVVGMGLVVVFLMATLVLFVLYWVRIAGYGRELADDEEEHGLMDDEDEDEDDDPTPPTPADQPPPLPPEAPANDPPR